MGPLLWVALTLAATAFAWPDGAPCTTSTFDSMNPLEAVEHQGGLQLIEPPYEIEVEQRCYWRSQPIAFTLQGKNESVWFKGFAIQPYEWNNGVLGKKMGRLLRLDDNGSWQYQCFRFHDSATHSHNQRKKHMKMWWRNDDDDYRHVQLVATVVHSQKRFWVRSVVSKPIPPCRVKREFGPYTPPLPVAPPPVANFKMETDKEFGNFFVNEIIPDSVQRANQFTTAAPNNLVQLGGRVHEYCMFQSPSRSFAFNFQQQAERERQLALEQQRSEQRQREMERERADRERADRERADRQRAQQEFEDRNRRIEEQRARLQAEQNARIEAQRARQRAEAIRRQLQAQQRRIQPQPQRNQGNFQRGFGSTASGTQAPQPISNNGVCSDIDPPSRCIPWSQYCQASTYMHQYCRRTCHFC